MEIRGLERAMAVGVNGPCPVLTGGRAEDR